jgi:hypothetical protein
MKPKFRRRKNKKNNGTSMVKRSGVPMPPPYTPTSSISRKFRFYANITGGGAVTTYIINAPKLCALQSFALTTTSLVQMFETVRVRSIKIWGSPPQNGLACSCRVEFSGAALGIQGDNRSVSDYSMGMTKPAFVKCRPSPSSQASQWQTGVTTNTSNLFSITLNPQSLNTVAFIIDISVDLRVSTDQRTTLNVTTVTGPATVSGIYYLALDNNCSAALSTSNNLTPDESLPTII